ncbi:hypothetical protein UY3_02085 [Chelonia mydas]|uniref:Uncharacterized protein n=1 Tax=Chelonia mydas TaxID=8469 RepID=M7BXW8_CHEMY|nr:hypothetical protein UY3_02085 [Chelonia mydas]
MHYCYPYFCAAAAGGTAFRAATLTSALRPTELGPQSEATTLRPPSSEGRSTEGDQHCCNRCSECRFSGSSEDPLNRLSGQLQYASSPRRARSQATNKCEQNASPGSCSTPSGAEVSGHDRLWKRSRAATRERSFREPQEFSLSPS